MSQLSIRAQIASAIRVVVQLQRLSDGKRRVMQISEITGMEGEVVQLQTIYEFVRTGVDARGVVHGELRATRSGRSSWRTCAWRASSSAARCSTPARCSDMPSLETIAFQPQSYGPMVAVAAAVFLALEALFLMWALRRRREGRINARLRVKSGAADGRAALVALRRRRGLTADGRYELLLIAFNRLVMQSGLAIPVWRLLLLMAAAAAVIAVLTYSLTRAIPLAALAAAFVGFGLPVMMLLVMRSKRLKALEAQLPEAVDVMVRSLRAGHPLPVAIAMVARARWETPSAASSAWSRTR